MLKIVTLICALAGILAAIILIFWIRRRTGSDEGSAALYASASARSAVFSKYQCIHILIMTVPMTVIIGMGISWKNAAVYLIGAVCSFISVIAGSGISSYGIAAESRSLRELDLRESSRISYRTGAVAGLIVSSMWLIVIGILYVVFDIRNVMNLIASLGLGASTCAVFMNSGGGIYSNAYAVSMREGDVRDISGLWQGSAAGIMECTAVSVTSVAMLAELGVNTSGVSSTFTAAMAGKFPLLIFASGIAASIIGIMLFRTASARRPHSGINPTILAAGIIVVLMSVYFSLNMLQSAVYAWCILAGLAASIISAYVKDFLVYDSKFLKGSVDSDRKLGSNARYIFRSFRGMYLVFIDAIVIIIALVVAFKFASLYGVALASAGVCSVNAIYSAINGMGIITAAAGDSLGNLEAYRENSINSHYLYVIPERTGVFADSFSASTSFFSTFGLLLAVIYTSGKESLNLLNTHVLAGFIGGVGAAFVITGSAVSALRMTSGVLRSNSARSGGDDNIGSLRGAVVPLIISILIAAGTGFLFGMDSLNGLILGLVLTEYFIFQAFTLSGNRYCSTTIRSAGSLVRFIALFAAVFVRVIVSKGGLLF